MTSGDGSGMQRQIQVYHAILETSGQWFTAATLRRKLELPKGTVHRWLQAYVQEGIIERREVPDGWPYYRLTASQIGWLMSAAYKARTYRSSEEHTAS